MPFLITLSVLALSIASPVFCIYRYHFQQCSLPLKPDLGQLVINAFLMILLTHTYFMLSFQADNPWVSHLWLSITALHFLFCLTSLLFPYLWRLVIVYHPYQTFFIFLLVISEWIQGQQRSVFLDISITSYAHIFVSELTFAFISLAAVIATTILCREYGLKNKKNWQILHVLPPLAVLSKCQTRFLMTGLLLLAVGIVSGMIWSWQLNEALIVFNHKTIFVLSAFVLLVLMMISEYELGWQGKNVTRFVLSSYLLILLGYHGVLFVKYNLLTLPV